ncbi:MAG: hypothetical protein ACJ79Q_06705 [Gemmatimonadaceae bacterium]
MKTTTTTVSLSFQGGTGSPPPATASQQARTRELQNAARELRDAIRNNVDQQLIQSQAQDAATAALAQVQITPPIPPSRHGPFTFRQPDGQTITIQPGAFDNVIPPQVVDISIAFFITIAVIIIGLPLARAFARRMDRRTAGGQVPTEVASQISHLNQAVDAIAVEVERISEGQRYTTRLLTEQRDASRTTLPSAANR